MSDKVDFAKLFKIAQKYVDDTERYDRSVCSLREANGVAMPGSPKEKALIGENAHKTMRKSVLEADRNGLGRDLLVSAIADIFKKEKR